MTLPVPGTPWPPKKWGPVNSMVSHASVWWQGDSRQLDSHYAGSPTYRDSQFQGGVVGAVSRFFWGAPTPKGQSTRKLHLPLAADIAATSATLLFDTPPTFKVDGDGQDRLDHMLNDDLFPAKLLVMGESAAALGGVYGRIMWDTDVKEHPWIDFVDADAAYPEFSYGELTAVTFVEELAPTDEKHTWRLLSRYVPGRIQYGLYMGNADNLGHAMGLADHDATRGLAQLVDADSSIESHTTGIAATYIPNALPVVGFRRDGQLKHIGRPDLSPDLYGLFDLLDETWTDIRREMRLGRQRATVPEHWLDRGKFGGGMAFDEDREFFTTVNARPDESAGINFYQPSLRFDSYLKLAEQTVLEVLRRANYSPATFGIAGSNAAQKTAREIEAEYQSSVQTWKAKSRYVRAGLSHLANGLLEVDAWLNNRTTPTEKVTVQMVPPVQETMLDKASTIQALDAARAISTEEKVGMLRADWSQAQIDAEVERIRAENTGSVPVDYMGILGADEPIDPKDE